jgi:hypothetical protein
MLQEAGLAPQNALEELERRLTGALLENEVLGAKPRS